MNLNTARALAKSLMKEHGLTNWNFKFDRAYKRLGLTTYRTSTISLSRRITQLNPEMQVRNTILHEIAHALVGSSHGHNNVWREKAITIGCNGQRTTNSIVKVQPEHRIQCQHCGRSWGSFRQPKTLQGMWHRQCGQASLNQLVLI